MLKWLIILMLLVRIVPQNTESEFDKTERLLNELDIIIHEQGKAWENQ